jgi:hypothetical protein
MWDHDWLLRAASGGMKRISGNGVLAVCGVHTHLQCKSADLSRCLSYHSSYSLPPLTSKGWVEGLSGGLSRLRGLEVRLEVVR